MSYFEIIFVSSRVSVLGNERSPLKLACIQETVFLNQDRKLVELLKYSVLLQENRITRPPEGPRQRRGEPLAPKAASLPATGICCFPSDLFADLVSLLCQKHQPSPAFTCFSKASAGS